jgi:hypothetical protein
VGWKSGQFTRRCHNSKGGDYAKVAAVGPDREEVEVKMNVEQY